MKGLLFLGSYLVAFVPVMFAHFAGCYLICTVKLIGDCFGRPRATVAAVTHTGMSILTATLAAFPTNITSRAMSA